MDAGIDWIIFGDDWGGHPSTTQHLALNLPSTDRVVWVDSIGMRSPKLNPADLRRLAEKGRALLRGEGEGGALYDGTMGELRHVGARVLPFHDRGAAIAFNRRSLGRTIGQAMRGWDRRPTALLASYPVIVRYADSVPHDSLFYLRLDDYEHYPGVDPALVEATEDEMCRRADVVFATARTLIPEDWTSKSRYLPQGVMWEHFAAVPLEPPRSKVLGFFGTMAEWLDYDLIERVASRAPGWTLELLGQVDHLPDRIREIESIRLVPRVAYSDLPDAIAHWSAAWIPFQINTLTIGVNPLKVREYLAAGLPSHCAPLPEAADLADRVMITSDADEVVDWLDRVTKTDTSEARAARRESVRSDSWAARAERLRFTVSESLGRFDGVTTG